MTYKIWNLLKKQNVVFGTTTGTININSCQFLPVFHTRFLSAISARTPDKKTSNS